MASVTRVRRLRSKLEIPFVPTPRDVVNRMLDAANPQPDERVYDLGCGDGRILRAAVRGYGCVGLGYEIDPALASYAVLKARSEGLVHDRLRIVRGDLNLVDLRDADVVTLYLTPEALLRLRPALETQLKLGARVVSHNYRIRGWKPISVQELVSAFDGKRHTVFSYGSPPSFRVGERKPHV